MQRSTLLVALICVPAMSFAADGDQMGAPGTVSFEIGAAYQFTHAPFRDGHGFNVALNVPMKSLTLGYFFEKFDAQAEANDTNSATATKVDATVFVHELRAIKRLPGINTLGIGLGVGMGEFNSRVTDTNTENQYRLAQVADLFIKWSPLTGGDRFSAALNVIAGYRFMHFGGVDLDGSGTAFKQSTNDLDGFRLGFSAEFGF